MSYLNWDEQTITDFSPENLSTMYDRGFVCTRPEAGLMQQTRSIRIDLSQFEPNSENRRILRKTAHLTMEHHSLPYAEYSWEIGKMGKAFYDTKFGEGTFSANKIKELLTSNRGDFNTLLVYSSPSEGELEGVIQSQDTSSNPTAPLLKAEGDHPVGYAICVETPDILHYSYPFYNLDADKNTGMGMMVRAIMQAKESGKAYCYLGSAQRPGDVYKLQFAGFEWFDGEGWQTDIENLKKILTRDT